MNCITCLNCGKCQIRNNPDAYPLDVYITFTENGILRCDLYQQAYITPDQYRERTGREYPDDAPVWVYDKESIYIGACRESVVEGYHEGIICAFGDAMPPDDWRPKEE
jgi:hypothetical protein